MFLGEEIKIFADKLLYCAKPIIHKYIHVYIQYITSGWSVNSAKILYNKRL